MKRSQSIALFSVLALFCGLALAQRRPELRTGPVALNFKGAPLDMVLEQYSEIIGRTLLKAPGLKAATITLRNRTPLNAEEALEAMETVLAMHGIALLEEGEKFIRVVPIATARLEPMKILDEPEEDIPRKDTSKLISQMIGLKYIEIAEATKAITPLKHSYGLLTPFERINSILVTDSAATINRIMQIIKLIDQPIEAREEPHIIQIHYAKAGDIKSKLMEIIAESQKEAKKSTVAQLKTSGAPGVVAKPAVRGVIRAKKPLSVRKAATIAEIIDQAERGIIQGTVQIIADERTNLLIIITRPENMKFFEKIIKVLDVETAPDVMVKIIRLEFAEADTVASTLNTLIGSTAKGKDADKAIAGKGDQKEGESAVLREYVENLRAEKKTEKKKSKFGELSASNIKILPDKRTNSLLIMASKADMVTLEEIIKDMDIMLSQVLIEVVIFKISLEKKYERGIDWVQRTIIAYNEQAGGVNLPDMAFAGVAGGGADRGNIKDPLSATTLSSMSTVGGNLTYFFTFFDLNLNAIIKLIASDNRTKILSSPQILTTDNTEATISVTKERYYFKGLKYISTGGVAGQWIPDVQMKKVGTKLTVTPHINAKKFVLMEINQSLEKPGLVQKIQSIGGLSDWPTIDSTELTATVAVRSGETIVLGGIVDAEIEDNVSRVPILGSIPLLGALFRHKLNSQIREEIVIFITPYVLDTPEEIEAKTRRRKDAVAVGDLWPKKWSDSKMADPAKKEPAEEEKKEALARTKRALAEKEKELAEMREALAEQRTFYERPAVIDEPEEETEAGGMETVADMPTEPALRGRTDDAPAGLRPQGRREVVKQTAPALSDSDPELMNFITRQEKRWGRTLRKIDDLIENGTREVEPAEKP